MCSAPGSTGWTALVLAGGRGSRLQGADKAAITIGGTLGEAEMGWVEDIDTPADLRKARSTHTPATNDSPPPRPTGSSTPKQGANPMITTWINAVCAELELPPDVNVDVILDVARLAAHTVERPAAPVTTFLLGLAAAGGMDVTEAAAKIHDLATTWPTSKE